MVDYPAYQSNQTPSSHDGPVALWSARLLHQGRLSDIGPQSPVWNRPPTLTTHGPRTSDIGYRPANRVTLLGAAGATHGPRSSHRLSQNGGLSRIPTLSNPKPTRRPRCPVECKATPSGSAHSPRLSDIGIQPLNPFNPMSPLKSFIQKKGRKLRPFFLLIYVFLYYTIACAVCIPTPSGLSHPAERARAR